MQGYQERLEGLAEVASAGLGATVKVLDEWNASAYGPGLRLLETGTHYIDVYPMIFNWRLSQLPKGERVPDRYWCYRGTGTLTLLRIVAVVREWRGDQATEPYGWVKNGQTGETRE